MSAEQSTPPFAALIRALPMAGLCPLADKLDESCMQKTPLQFVGPASLRWGGPGGKQIFFNGTDVTEGVQPPGSVWRMNPIPRNDPWGNVSRRTGR